MMNYILRMTVLGLCGLALTACVSPSSADLIRSENHSDGSIARIAFGACNNPRKDPVGMYPAILGEQPDVFIFLGDNIYGDTQDMKVLQAKYAKFGAGVRLSRITSD